MKRAYGRDFGLSARMVSTMFLLGALYVVFFLVLLQFTNLGIGFLILIMGGLALFQYYTSDKIASRASGAKIVDREEAPELYDMVERLCAMADLPKPRVADPHRRPERVRHRPEAQRAAVAVTEGLWQRPEPEIEVLRTSSLTSATATRDHGDHLELLRDGRSLLTPERPLRQDVRRRCTGVAPVWLIMFVVSLVTYAISYVLILMISRYREYAADRGAALITGRAREADERAPEDRDEHPGFPSATCASSKARTRSSSPDERELVVSELFAHPPLEKRFARLAEIRRRWAAPSAGWASRRPLRPEGAQGGAS